MSHRKFVCVEATADSTLFLARHVVRVFGTKDERISHRFIEIFLDQHPERSKLVLLAPGRSTPLWYRAFSMKHDNKYACAEGSHEDRELVTRFLGDKVNKEVDQGDLSSFPALFIHCGRTNMSHPVREWFNYNIREGEPADHPAGIIRHCHP